jgi:hypothetical protein
MRDWAFWRELVVLGAAVGVRLFGQPVAGAT